MENKDQNMETLDPEAIRDVSGGLLQDGLEYLEELKKKYDVATLDEVKELWTVQEQMMFEMLLRKGMNPQKPTPTLPGLFD